MSTPKIGAVLALDGEKEYKSAITSINTAQRELRSEMKLATERFSEHQNAIDALTEKQVILTKQHDSQTEKVKICTEAYEKYSTLHQELKTKMDAAEASLKKEESALKTLRSTTGATTEEIEEQEKAVDEARAALKDATAEYNSADKKQNEWKISLNNAQASLLQTDRALEENSKYLKEAQQSTDGCATSIDAFGKSTQKAGEEAEKFGKTSTSAITQLNAALQSSGITEKIKAVGNTLLDCADAAATFETSMAKVSTLVDTSETSMSDMSAEVLAVSSDLGVAATEIAEATYQAISAGQSAESAVSMVGTATKLSIGGFTDSATAVDIMTTALNAYGLEAEEAESVSDMLITTQNLGKTTVSELAATMGRVIPLASAYNVEMDNLSSAYAIMTANGIATAETTTYLKSMLNELGDSGSTVAGILQKQTGKGFAELSSEGYSLGDVMEILGDSVDGDTTKFSELWSSSEAGIGALSLLNSGSTKYNSTLKSMQDSAGATTAAFEKMSDTTEMAQQRMENAAQNLKIAVGEEFTPALENLYEMGGDVMEFLTEFAEENPEIVDLLAATTAGVVTFTGALTAATVAAQAFAVIRSLVNPTSLLVTALMGCAVAAGTFAAAMSSEKSEIEKTTAATKDLVKESKDLNSAYESEAKSRSDAVKEVQTEAAVCKDLVSRLEELQEKTSLTAEEQSEQQLIVTQLNESIPDLGLAIDETTGKINQSTEALEANVEALLDQALAAAAQEKQAEIAEKLIDAQMELKELQEQMDVQTQAVADAQEAYNAALEDGSVAMYRSIGAMDESELALQNACSAQEELQNQIAATNDTIAAYEDEFAQMQEYVGDTTAQEAASEATETLGDTSSETADKIAQMSETAQQAYTEMYESLSESISSQFDLFDEYEEAQAQNTSNFIENMEKQVAGLDEWASNLETLADEGINQGLLQKLADMGPEGADYVATFAAMTSDELDKANEAWEKSLAIQDDVAERIALAYAELGESSAISYTEGVAQAMGEESASGQIEDAAKETGKMMPAGVAEGAIENIDVATDAMTELGEKSIGALNESVEEESPSKRTAETGEYLVRGLAEGVTENKKLATDALAALGKESVAAAEKEMGYAVFYEIGTQIDQGLADGIRDGKSEVINAAVEVAIAAVQAARDELGIASPAKATIEMGGYYMEGWVEGIQAKTDDLKNAVQDSLADAMIINAAPAAASIEVMGAEASGSGDTFYIYFQPQSMTDSELDRAFDYINERFGRSI